MPDLLADKALLLAGIAFLIVLIFTVTRSVASFRRYLLQKLGQETVFDMREALYAKVHALGLDYHGSKRTGDTITRVTSDVKEVRTMLVDSVVEVFSSVTILIGMMVVMLWLDWQLTLLALVTVPFLFLAVNRYRQALVQRMRIVRAREGAIASVMQEAIIGIRAVKLFAREDDEMERFRTESRESLKASVDSAKIEAKFSTVLGIVGGLGTALVVYFGARQVLSGALSLGDLTVFVAYLALFLSPLWALSRQVNQIGTSLVSGERIIDLLNAEPTVKDLPGARPAPEFDGRVTFEDVRFAYDDEAGEVLRGVDFDVEAGSRVALVGVSGAGKTTVTSLIARLYDPQEGRVLIDGERRQGLYPQVVARLHNLRAPGPLALQGERRREHSLRAARGEPGGDRGRSRARRGRRVYPGAARRLRHRALRAWREPLSGGQRQRISIARAMLRDTPILILDEPQSGLDAEAAAAVEESWRALTEGRTTFVIAHELRLVRSVDTILVLEDGSVAETGTHEELVSSGGLYARLYALQERDPVQP